MNGWDTAPVNFDIASRSNERIKWLRRLRDRAHRDAEGVFVVEGRRLYQRALGAGHEPVVTFVSEPDIEVASGERVTVTPEVLDRASYRSRSQGLIAVFNQHHLSLDDIDPGSNPLLLIAENVEKPGNLGAMCRTAAAAGVGAVIAVDETVDRWNPNALHASTGSIFSLPLVALSWEEVVPWLAGNGIQVIAASPDADETIWEVDLTRPIGVVIGAEDGGLSEEAVSRADRLVAIPQMGTGVDSLNASVAAGVILFEARRQRALVG